MRPIFTLASYFYPCVQFFTRASYFLWQVRTTFGHPQTETTLAVTCPQFDLAAFDLRLLRHRRCITAPRLAERGTTFPVLSPGAVIEVYLLLALLLLDSRFGRK